MIRTSFWIAAMMLAGCSAETSAPTQFPTNAPLQTPQGLTNTAAPPPTGTSTRLPVTPTASPTPGLPFFTDDDIQNQVSHLAAGFMKSSRNPGLSVALIRPNLQTRQLEAMLLNFGSTAKGGGEPVDSNTVYEIGSITKVFTGILLAQAVQAGQMKLTDPIQGYLPDGVRAPDYKGIPITLGELATHRSGLPRDLNSDNLSDLYDWLNRFRLSQAPGSQYVYSNLAYSLLGDILARNANTDFGTLVLQSVSLPLGLTDTTEVLSEDQTNRLAQGYAADGSLARYFPDSGAMGGAGYLRSTLHDLARFLAANMQTDSTPVASALDLAQAVQSEGSSPATGTGLGWEIIRPGEPDERIWKAGGTPGFTSYISFANDRSWGFVLLSNGQFVDSLVPNMIHLMTAARSN